MVRSGHRHVAAFVGLCLLLTFLPGCQRARSGARCRTANWGDDGAFVLKCVGGRWKRVLTRQQAIDIIVASLKPPVGEVVRPEGLGLPGLPNTADPAVLVDGGRYYVFSTTTFRRAPVRVIDDIDATYTEPQLAPRVAEAMPQRPAWARDDEIWAPAVAKIGSSYLMYFAAHRSGVSDSSRYQCVGRAVASAPAGPYVPDATPVTCGNDGINGALDPSVFIGPDGAARLLVAMGGSAVNIWSFPLDGAGNVSGPSVALLTRNQPWEDWFLENAAMVFDGSTYLLAYSAGRWQSADYMTGIARCKSPAGPCTARPDGPWLRSIGDRVGPGGLEFFRGNDGQLRTIFHTYPSNNVVPVGARSSHVRRFQADPWPRLG